jgi:hypothetical protein
VPEAEGNMWGECWYNENRVHMYSHNVCKKGREIGNRCGGRDICGDRYRRKKRVFYTRERVKTSE